MTKVLMIDAGGRAIPEPARYRYCRLELDVKRVKRLRFGWPLMFFPPYWTTDSYWMDSL